MKWEHGYTKAGKMLAEFRSYRLTGEFTNYPHTKKSQRRSMKKEELQELTLENSAATSLETTQPEVKSTPVLVPTANSKDIYYIERAVGKERFYQLLDEMRSLHDQKQCDYGREDDSFSNVRASEEWGIDSWKGAMIRATDKIRRLQKYAKTGTLANEGVADSFMDLACYALIAQILWEEENE